MFKQKHCFILLLFIIFTIKGISVLANEDYSFKNYNSDNGLSQNTVWSIFQDNLGFMWFGTKDGLNRFDGSTFKVFKFSTDSDLRDNVFHRILQDKNEDIWVATEEGVYVYNIYQEQFRRFNKHTINNDSVHGVVTEMIADEEGDIWMSVEGKGIFHYSIEDDDLMFYSIAIVEDGMKKVSLCSDNSRGVWAFPYSSPIIHINKVTKEVSEFNLFDDEELLFHTGEIHGVFSDQNNLLLLSTSQKGLISINTINRTHKILLEKDSYGEPIFVRTIEKIDPNTLWIGSETGIYIYNRETGDVRNIRHNPNIPTSLSDNAIYSIFKDKDGGIWVGTYFGGVDYYSDLNNKFELFFPIINKPGLSGKRVREICRAQDGNIWIGTEDGGLNLFDPKEKVFLPLPIPLKTLYTNIHALLQDGDNFWISTYSKGLNRYNFKTGELVTYTHNDHQNSISQTSTFALCKDRQGLLWVGTLSGVDLYDDERDQFIKVEELIGMSILDIFEDSNGFIWISTFQDGLFRYNPATKEWKVFTYDASDNTSLPYYKPTSMYEDSKRRLWVTTQGGGFGLFDPINEKFTRYNSSKGLPNDVVYQIVEDDEGFLWLSTNQGLVKFDAENELFINFTVENGLKTNQFNYKSSYKDAEGNIYFGSIDGFIRFNPSLLNTAETNNEVIFTELLINNILVNPSYNKSPIDKSIMVTDEIKLPYYQNSVSLKFSLLDYTLLYKNRIFYKLEGFDDNWIKTADNQSIIYSNLNPGKYKLILGSLEQGSIDTIRPLKTLLIIIRPPFWLNIWAYLIYFILISFGLLLLYRLLNIRNKMKRQEGMRIFEQEKERELYKSKINFFTNVAHEIRTPLTLIKAPLDHILKSEAIPENINENLLIMRKNTSRLLDLTNQLLDFRKTESDSFILNVEPQNVTKLIKDYHLRFTPFAKQKGIQFDLHLPEHDLYAQVDRDAFKKILTNLLSNGIKYCDNFIKVSAYISGESERTLHLITENDGELIPKEYKEEIFKPFVQFNSNEDKSGSGTGIGLALARTLAELHNGSIHLENDTLLNKFHLILPVGDVKESIDQIEEIAVNETSNDINLIESKNEATVLLVDDDIELLQFEAKFLSEYYNVHTAKNGREALNVLKRTNINIVVSDVMMPEMDGFELTEKVKSNIEFSHIPVILLTAKVNAQSKVQGYELGADAYLDKPFSIDVLLARIENLLQSREILRESFLKNPFIGASTVALTKSDEEFITKLNNLIQENISESEFNVESMAEHFNMSRASFYRKVKGVLNLTPNEYIRVKRLKHAAEILRDEDIKVNEVSYMVGFNSPSYFAKCFQQQFGILPKDFQEQK